MNRTLTLYGIPNCDTVKKARAWLGERGTVHDFHDFRKRGVSAEMLMRWSARVGWEKLLNRQGTTWRKLHAAERLESVDADLALRLMQSHPSLIRRPVLEAGDALIVGFDPEHYAALR